MILACLFCSLLFLPVQAQDFTIDTPTNSFECGDTIITWNGGTPPYVLAIIPPSIMQQEIHTGLLDTVFIWDTPVAAGSQVVLQLTDEHSASATDGSSVGAFFTVMAGTDTSCLVSYASSSSLSVYQQTSSTIASPSSTSTLGSTSSSSSMPFTSSQTTPSSPFPNMMTSTISDAAPTPAEPFSYSQSSSIGVSESAASSSSSAATPTSVNRAGVVAGVVSAAIVAVALAAVLCICRRRRRTARAMLSLGAFARLPLVSV